MKRISWDQKKWCSALCVLAVLGCFTALVGMQSQSNPFSTGISSTDSSVFRYVAWRMTEGEMPYKDTFDHKGPLLYVMNYLGMQLGYTRGVWLLEMLILFIAALFLYHTARLFLNRAASLLSVGMVFSLFSQYYVGGNYAGMWALPFLSLSLYCFTRYLRSDNLKRTHIFLCGAACASVLLLKPNMIAVWAGSIISIGWKEIARKRWTRLRTECLYFLLGMAAVLLPFLFWLGANRALQDCWDCYIVFNMKYSHGATRYDRIKVITSFLNTNICCLAVAGMVLWYCHNRKAEEERWIFRGSLMTFLAAMCSLGLATECYGDYGIELIPVFLLPISILFRSVQARKASEPLAAAAVVLGIVCLIGLPRWLEMAHNVKILPKPGSYYAMEDTVNLIKDYTTEQDSISVFGNADYYYLRSGRRSASRYSYQFPIAQFDQNIVEEYKADIRTNKPKLILLVQAENERWPMEDFEPYIQSLGYQEVHSDVYVLE